LPVYAAETGVDGVGLDSLTSPAWVKGQVPGKTLQGNLDPFALLAGGKALEKRARAILQAMHGTPFIFNLGHGIDKETPIAHVEALVKILRNKES
ncbi:MAG: uroporphyrinogen decarboxylase, partial [Alphaproteobacteria bacterium]|nr:uroporphyrinogen decarboxylase [Alphaproteobacteria bacterium]